MTEFLTYPRKDELSDVAAILELPYEVSPVGVTSARKYIYCSRRCLYGFHL
jgi:hypothetical protein